MSTPTKLSWYELTVLDEVGEPLADTELEFQVSGQKKKRTTATYLTEGSGYATFIKNPKPTNPNSEHSGTPALSNSLFGDQGLPDGFEKGDLVVWYTGTDFSPAHFLINVGMLSPGDKQPSFACHSVSRVAMFPHSPDGVYRFIHIVA